MKQEKKAIDTVRIALVTGGIRGIGKAVVEDLHKNGFFVIVNYRKKNKETEKIIAEMSKNMKSLSFIEADISNKKNVEKMFKKIKAAHTHIDILINSAGIIETSKDETLENITEESLNKYLDTNFLGGIYVTQESIPLLKRSLSGRIIFINSALSFIGSKRRFGYVTSKTINVGTVRALSLELAPFKICVNAVVPGYIETRMSSFTGRELSTKLEKIPLNRIGSSEEVAYLVSFLCSNKSSYITGQHLHINGGLYLS